jgi:hypothetical protein
MLLDLTISESHTGFRKKWSAPSSRHLIEILRYEMGQQCFFISISAYNRTSQCDSFSDSSALYSI